MNFSDFARDYITDRDVSTVYADTMLRRAAALEDFVGRTAIHEVLTEDNLNAFLASLDRLRPHTIKSYRGDLLSLWRAAGDLDIVPYPNARRIRRNKLPSLIIECYSEDEVLKLLAAAARCRGCMTNGVGRRHYWSAAIRFAWDTGLRRGDCWRFDRASLRPDLTFRQVQHKTGAVVRRRLRKSTVDALDAIKAQLPLAWPHTAWAFGDFFHRLAKSAGVGRGSFKWLRRASGSYAEALTPGAGSKVLGHSDPSMFRKHYDAQVDGEVPMPPELGVVG